MNVRERLEWFSVLWADEGGQDMVEYALLAGLVAVASGLFASDMSDSMKIIYSRVASRLEQAIG